MLKDDWVWNLSTFSNYVSWSNKSPSSQKKDALPVGTESIVEHGGQINVGIVVLAEDVVKPELHSKNAM